MGACPDHCHGGDDRDSRVKTGLVSVSGWPIYWVVVWSKTCVVTSK